ncbi:MAG: VTT domain-containing protein, partial [Pseudobdellovibrionaceae bacterium]
DATNYQIGKFLGPKVFNKEKSFFFNRTHLAKTQEFYEKYGSMTIVIARFMPIVRTFAPFVAGIGKMQYRKFAVYNVAGAFAWVLSFTLAGYFFGNIPVVKRNFTIVIFGVIIVSVLPIFYGWIQSVLAKRKNGTAH